jgi:G6PDH family F420-dependent oxidoreductase
VGSGEALNEHILGDPWPSADVRLEMLEEAIEVIRALWTGTQVDHSGRHYRVENAELYTRPDEPPPILVSGFGPKAVDLAARVGDGYCITMPDPGLIGRFRSRAGDKRVEAGTKVCYGASRDAAVATAHRIWPNEVLPGELAQVLPQPAHFEQASELVTDEMVADAVPCGPDLDEHVTAIQEFADAGVDHLYVQQIGSEQEAFFKAYAKHVLPRFG